MFTAFLMTYIVYLLPILLVGLPVVFFTRSKVKWYKRETLLLIVPFIFWYLSLAITSMLHYSKSLSNAAFEPLLVGLLVAIVIPLIKLCNKSYFQEPRKANMLIFIASLLALAIGFLIPGLPE